MKMVIMTLHHNNYTKRVKLARIAKLKTIKCKCSFQHYPDNSYDFIESVKQSSVSSLHLLNRNRESMATLPPFKGCEMSAYQFCLKMSQPLSYPFIQVVIKVYICPLPYKRTQERLLQQGKCNTAMSILTSTYNCEDEDSQARRQFEWPKIE